MLCGQIIVCMTVTPNNSLASFNSLCSILSLQPRSHGYMAIARWPLLFLTGLPIVCKNATCWVLSIRKRHVIDGSWVMIGQSGMRFKAGRTLGGNERSKESWHCRSATQFGWRWGWEAPGNCGSCSVFSHLHDKTVCTSDLMCFLINVTWLCGSADTIILEILLKQRFSSRSISTPHGYLINF